MVIIIDACKLCSLTNENLRDYTYFKEFVYWHVRVTPAQHKLGSCVISLKRHIERAPDLNEGEIIEFLKIQTMLESVISDAFSPSRYNYLQLGNVVRHYHVHLIPRYEQEVIFAGKTWGDENPKDTPIMKSEKDQEELISQIKIKLSSILQRKGQQEKQA